MLNHIINFVTKLKFIEWFNIPKSGIKLEDRLNGSGITLIPLHKYNHGHVCTYILEPYCTLQHCTYNSCSFLLLCALLFLATKSIHISNAVSYLLVK